MKNNRFSNKPAGIISIVELKSFKGRLIYSLFFALMCIIAFCTLFPVVWIVLTAFKSTQEIYSSTAFLPKDFSFGYAIDRIKTSWITLALGQSMINTLIVSFGNVVAKIIVCGLAGYVLSKLKVKGTKVIFVLVVWTMMMPGTIRTVPLYMSYISFPFVADDGINIGTNFNILDTYWPIWLGTAADSFSIILFKNNFDAIPTALVEASRIDGCSNIKIFYKIMLPIAMPVVVYISIGVLRVTWADYFTPYIVLKDVAKMTTPARIFLIKNDRTVTTNIYMMGLIFASIPPMLIFCVFQKYIVGGIAVGSVKG